MAQPPEKPFLYLTSEQFLALTQEQRIAYRKRVEDHLAELKAIVLKAKERLKKP